MSFSEFLLLLLIAAGLWYWLDAMRTKEIAIQACRNACQNVQVELLDETVALSGVHVRRDRDGAIRLLRKYSFEFTNDAAYRYSGEISLLGKRVLQVDLDVHRLP